MEPTGPNFFPAGRLQGPFVLSNAKVYCLAQYKSISTLRTLARKRIFLLLLKINPLPRETESSAVLNSLDLVNYVYSNIDSFVNSEEPLRKLVWQFTAYNLEVCNRDRS